MALSYHPEPGEILLCDYWKDAAPPEMVKRRPVIVQSPRRRRSGVVIIVALSATPPLPVQPHHCQIILATPLPGRFNASSMWAKCDMLATVSLARLDKFRERDNTGQRRYVSGRITEEQLRLVCAAVLNALGLTSLTVHL